jgi:hypothetical protein
VAAGHDGFELVRLLGAGKGFNRLVSGHSCHRSSPNDGAFGIKAHIRDSIVHDTATANSRSSYAMGDFVGRSALTICLHAVVTTSRETRKVYRRARVDGDKPGRNETAFGTVAAQAKPYRTSAPQVRGVQTGVSSVNAPLIVRYSLLERKRISGGTSPSNLK